VESRSCGERIPSGLQSKQLLLARSLDGWINQPRDADAARQQTFHGGPDQVGRQGGERDASGPITAPLISSSSQRRPRAIARTSVARVSARIGR
jgi:hypothetical protein